MIENNKVVGRAVIANAQGLHMRPISAFTKVAREFNCKIHVRYGEIGADGKAVMELLSLGAPAGSELVIEAEGDDAAAAVAALVALVADRFGIGDDETEN